MAPGTRQSESKKATGALGESQAWRWLLEGIFRRRRFAAFAVQDAEERLMVGACASLGEEGLGFHGSDLFGSRNYEELIHAGAVALSDLFKGGLH
ncbi:MAG: hypothetical protein WBE74_01135 [Terracidiphilus sp.]